MLPKNRFSHGQSRDKFLSRKGHRQTERMIRICMDCAVSNRYYAHLQPVFYRGAIHRHCHYCGSFSPEGACCKKLVEPYEYMPVLLIETTTCFPKQYKPGSDLSNLEKLPRNVVANIAKFMCYQDAISLGRVSQWMYRTVRPAEMAPLHERFLFTELRFKNRKPAMWRPQKRHDFLKSERLPCFVCFRVRDKKHFSERQISMADENQWHHWRLRCNLCLHRMYVDGDEELLARYKSYKRCSLCMCLKARGTNCQFCREWWAVPEPVHPMQITPVEETHHVGSYDPWRGRSFLTPATYPGRKNLLRYR
ncbi:hypothetical protein IMZ48_02715 [Candidatus Bathyarchaeota archaeon]|nr:hypothetical protein [Candidatus Bathyarchaeota archaeon]